MQNFRKALESLDRIQAETLFQQALTGDSVIEVVERFVVPALEQIGQRWNDGHIALSQVYMSGKFCEELVDRALPPCAPERKHQPRQAIVVLNDYHMLGKRIVYSVMRASGFELFDYGRMDVGELVERIVVDKLEILLVSVLMLPSALKIRELRDALDARGIALKILVGGAPFQFDPQLWQEVGADAMGLSAADAVVIVQRWAGDMA
ncbi:cobalamin B12-binding domain-containing protein [Methylomonas sp. LL1]|uniref:cobalamin B12-binding domain-containing protein n=1 Tax=Methylomonas sp. LL1 TaxID=2785785 RepID=UPI0018C3C5FC|nr:cobalamin-dependent protein [Methylomonas sp. LL1]